MGRIVLVMAALVVIGLPLATDYSWRTVVTGSMRPAIQPGDVILMGPGETEVAVGDVVVFQDPVRRDRDVVHRVNNVGATGEIQTRGDANGEPDPWTLSSAEVKGEVIATVPKLGFLISAMSSRLGIVLFLVVPSMIILGLELRLWYRFIRFGSEALVNVRRGRHLSAKAVA